VDGEILMMLDDPAVDLEPNFSDAASRSHSHELLEQQAQLQAQ
jgi:hypothetical protein